MAGSTAYRIFGSDASQTLRRVNSISCYLYIDAIAVQQVTYYVYVEWVAKSISI